MRTYSIALLLALCGSSAMAQDLATRFQSADQKLMAAVWNAGFGPARICALNYVVRKSGAGVAEAYVRDLETLAAQSGSYGSLSDLMLATSRLPRKHGITFEDQTAMTTECGMGL